MANLALVVPFAGYLLLLLGVGVYFYMTKNRETKRLTDYLLAGREAGTWTTAFSQVASGASGYTFFGWVGIGYALGVQAFMYAFFAVIMQLVTWRFIAPKFRRQSGEYDSVTMVDHLARYFHDKNRQGADVIRVLGTLIVVGFLGIYLAAQMQAIGQTGEVIFEIDYVTTILVGGVVVAIYTTLGGYNASIWTDYLQGWLMVAAAIGFPLAAIQYAGGFEAFLTGVAEAGGAGLVTWNGGLEISGLFLGWAGLLGISLGFIGQPHVMQRFQAIESEKLLSRGSVIATVLCAIRQGMPIFIGLSGYVILDSVGNPENIMIEGLPALFPSVIAGIIMAGIMSAILSTTDSMVLLTASEVTRSIYERFINPDASERKLVYVGRIIVVVFMTLAVLVASLEISTIFALIVFGWTGLAAALGIPLVMELFWELTTAEGVIAGMIVGFVSTAVNNQMVMTEIYPLLAYPVTFLAVIVVSYLTRKRVVAEPEAVGSD
jgi:sodium/proline symporter